MECFLEFLYTGDYFPKKVPGQRTLEKDPSIPDVDMTGDQLLKHAKVYTLADKFGLAHLKNLASSKIHCVKSTAKGEIAYARYVYQYTARDDTSIRVPVANFWATRSHTLRAEAEELFRSLCLEFPQFGYDVLSMLPPACGMVLELCERDRVLTSPSSYSPRSRREAQARAQREDAPRRRPEQRAQEAQAQQHRCVSPQKKERRWRCEDLRVQSSPRQSIESQISRSWIASGYPLRAAGKKYPGFLCSGGRRRSQGCRQNFRCTMPSFGSIFPEPFSLFFFFLLTAGCLMAFLGWELGVEAGQGRQSKAVDAEGRETSGCLSVDCARLTSDWRAAGTCAGVPKVAGRPCARPGSEHLGFLDWDLCLRGDLSVVRVPFPGRGASLLYE